MDRDGVGDGAAPSLFVLLAGWGAPNLAAKRDILRANLARIAAYPWQSVYVRACVYDPSPEARLDAAEMRAAFGERAARVRVDVREETGAPGDFVRRFARPEDPPVRDADYALLLLDDVEFQPDADFAELLRYQRDFGPAIVAPALTRDSLHVFPHMLQRAPEPGGPRGGRYATITPVCEFFAYFMDTTITLPRYHAFLDPANPWMWGMDLLLGRRMGIKVVLVNHVTVRHYFKGSGAEPSTFAARARYLAKHGETEASAAQQRPFLYYLLDGAAPAAGI